MIGFLLETITFINISSVPGFRVARVALGTSILFFFVPSKLQSSSIMTRHTQNAQPQCICMKLLFYNIYRAVSAKEGYADVPKSDSFPMGSLFIGKQQAAERNHDRWLGSF